MINSNASSLIVHFPCGGNLAQPNHNLYTRFLALFLAQILNLGGRPANTPNKALISCSYLITMRTLHSPHMLIIYYTEVSTLLIQEVALAPINWIGMVNIPLGGPVRSGGALHREVERDT